MLTVYETLKYRMDRARDENGMALGMWHIGRFRIFEMAKTSKSDRISVFQVSCFLHVSDHFESDCI